MIFSKVTNLFYNLFKPYCYIYRKYFKFKRIIDEFNQKFQKKQITFVARK